MRVIGNQSLFDIAVQESGSVEASFDWALKNGLSITDELIAGTELDDPKSVYTNIDSQTYFKGRQQKIATALTGEQTAIIIPAEGIGAMIIEDSFIVY